jgi:hypothetical protein
MEAFIDFATLTREALAHAIRMVALDADVSLIERLCERFDRLDLYPDAVEALAGLRKHRLAILSNGIAILARQPSGTPLSADQSDINFALDVAPLASGAQTRDQLPEGLGFAGRIFEPGWEIERLTELATIVEASSHAGQPIEMRREYSAQIIRRSSWASRHGSPDFRIGISAARVASGRPRSSWRGPASKLQLLLCMACYSLSRAVTRRRSFRPAAGGSRKDFRRWRVG